MSVLRTKKKININQVVHFNSTLNHLVTYSYVTNYNQEAIIDRQCAKIVSIIYPYRMSNILYYRHFTYVCVYKKKI